MTETRTRPARLSIVIPVYNEEQTIEQVLDLIDSIDVGDVEKEVVVVDDGSTDATAQIIAGRTARGTALRLSHQSIINLGKGAAVRFGFKYATGDIILIQDADLELDPQECRRLIEPILNGEADVVYGSRFARGSRGVPRVTRWANRLLTWFTNLLYGVRLTDMETAYKVFRRPVLQRVALRCVGFDIEPEITARVIQAGFRIHELPIGYNPRRRDEGKKLSWTDGIDAVYTLVRCRIVPQRGRPAAS
jgi:glycosyltransferase involved in cell wall biosynthesis